MKNYPRHLLIISWIFIFIGALALVRTIDSILHAPRPTIDFFMVFALVGAGLLRRNALARSFAIALCMVTLVFQIVVVTAVILGKRAVGTEDFSSQFLFWLSVALTILASVYGLWALQNSKANAFFKR